MTHAFTVTEPLTERQQILLTLYRQNEQLLWALGFPPNRSQPIDDVDWDRAKKITRQEHRRLNVQQHFIAVALQDAEQRKPRTGPESVLAKSREIDPEAWVEADAGRHTRENNVRLERANDRARVIETARGLVENPSAWGSFDQGASDVILHLIAIAEAAAREMREARLDYERRILAAEVAGVKSEKAMREAAAHMATSFLVGDPANGVPLRSPSPHQIADAIRALPLSLGTETETEVAVLGGSADHG